MHTLPIKRQIAAALMLTLLLPLLLPLGAAAAYTAAPEIPEHYDRFTESKVFENYGFAFSSPAYRYNAGRLIDKWTTLPDGTYCYFVYVCDGNHTLRLCNYTGEVITREAWESWLTVRQAEQAEARAKAEAEAPALALAQAKAAAEKAEAEKKAAADRAEILAAAKQSETAAREGIRDNDLPLWLDKDYTLYENELEAIRLINVERAKAGLEAVTLNVNLCKIARIKADEMVRLNYFAHESPNYGKHKAMVDQFGLVCQYAGENAALTGSPSASNVVSGWMGSEPHKKHMLNPKHTDAGIGVANKDGHSYWSLFLLF